MHPRPVEVSNLEFHVLLALASGPMYGYAIKTAVEDESAGVLTPRAGSLYRVIARLMASGFVRETSAGSDEPHPGLERKYYALTAGGKRALSVEAQRLKQSAAIAAKRLRTVEGRG